MKLSKFVKRAKSESYCVVIHADDSGIWLGTRLALYNATELPYMEGKEQAGAVLDIDSKAWEKMFFDEKYTAHAGADFGMNLTETDPTEQEARRVPLEMFYKGMGLVGLVYGNGGELIFYDAALIAPIADVVKTSDYIQTVVRKTAGGAPYVVIKDGFEVLAGFAPLKIITKQFLEDLSEFESACVSQYMREQKQALDAADPDKQDEGAEQIGMEGRKGKGVAPRTQNLFFRGEGGGILGGKDPHRGNAQRREPPLGGAPVWGGTEGLSSGITGRPPRKGRPEKGAGPYVVHFKYSRRYFFSREGRRWSGWRNWAWAKKQKDAPRMGGVGGGVESRVGGGNGGLRSLRLGRGRVHFACTAHPGPFPGRVPQSLEGLKNEHCFFRRWHKQHRNDYRDVSA